MIFRSIVFMVITFMLSGCGDALKDDINAKFPKVSIDDQQKTAISRSAAALNAMASPNVAFGATMDELQKVLLTKELKEKGVKSVSLSAAGQLIRADVGFDSTFTDGNDLVRALQPRIAGVVTVMVGLGGGHDTTDTGSDKINVKFFPVFKTLYIDKIEVGGKYDVTAFSGAIAAVLGLFADNVSGALAALNIMSVDIPRRYDGKLDFARLIRNEDGGVTTNVKLTANPALLPLEVTAIALAVVDGNLVGLAQVDSAAGKPKNQARAPETQTVDAVVARVRSVTKEGFDIASFPKYIWVAVRKDLVSYTFNAVAAQAKLCAKIHVDIERETFPKTISFPDESSVDCTPTRNCSPKRTCDIQKCHDDRGCNACILRNPFTGGCVQRGNDPFCEAAKATANAACEADYAAKKADCERLKAQEKGQCEIEKSGEKTLCETKKEGLKHLSRTGDFGRIDSVYSGKADIDICLINSTLSSDLTKIDFILDTAGSGDVDLHVKFEPLGIVGHLTCQAPWTEDQRFRASVPHSVIPVSAGLRFHNDPKEPRYDFWIQNGGMKLRLAPSPAEFMMKSLNMNLSCQGMGLLRPLILPAAMLVPELRGEFKFDAAGKGGTVPLRMPAPKANASLAVEGVSETGMALVLRAVARPVSN